MCGICGELRLDGNPSRPRTIKRMLVSLQRRGPDHEGSLFLNAVGLGHRRLSVIDLSAHANQPMTDIKLKLSIVFNGTIYNYPQLREELIQLGHTFCSTGDTEVILKSYAQWGQSSVKKLLGVFAFAIWDENKRELFLARDRLGIKPLYYVQTKRFFRFASISQALLDAGEVDTDIDVIGLHHHLTLHAVVPAPATILKGLRKLPPAHTILIKANGQDSMRQYWRLRADKIDMTKDEEEWQRDIQAALSLAVERRLRIADVPVGVFLSGGLDSSLIVGLLARAGIGSIPTYSVGFEDQPEEQGNEFEYSDAVAERFATEHHKFYIDNTQVLKRLPETVDQMAEPMVGQDAIAFYLLAEQVSKHISVVQSGQGADEVFGGYFWYSLMQAEKTFCVKNFAKHYFDRSHAEMRTMIDEDFIGDDFTFDKIAQLLYESGTKEFINAVFHLDVTTLVVDDPVKRVDNMTMAHGLEARVPFLDHELVELAMQMPVEYKLAGGGKYIMKKIARGLLPDKVIDRNKGYFPVPALKYVRGEFVEFMRQILYSTRCRQRGLFQRHYVDKLLQSPGGYMTPLQGSKLWHLALLELWLQRNVDGCFAT